MTTHSQQQLVINDSEAMEQFGAQLAQTLPRGCCVYLRGPLAAGKTTFARGYVRALGHPGAVKSPTYTLVESYQLGAIRIHHFDLYRLADAAELEFIGIEEYLDGESDVLIEWPERGAGVLPPADVEVVLLVAGTRRSAQLISHSPALDRRISDFKMQ